MKRPPPWIAVLAVLLVFVALLGWVECRTCHFNARLVSFEFVPAGKATAIPGAPLDSSADAFVVRFETDTSLMHVAEVRQLQFRCTIVGSPLDGALLFGEVFPDLGDRRWQTDITRHPMAPLQYVARVRFLANPSPPDPVPYYRQQLMGEEFERLEFQVVGVRMAPGRYASSEMNVVRDSVRTAVATALAR